MSSPPRVYNLGSLNIDRVFRVPHLVRPGETLAASSYAELAGGKGLNQSVALARAGAPVTHIGRVGADGLWLREKLAAEGVDTQFVSVGPGATGQAIIQVDDAGENSIVLLAGENTQIVAEEIDQALAQAQLGSWLLVQNETSGVAHAMQIAKRQGLQVAFNPAPCDERVASYPLELVDLLCVNESEAVPFQGALRDRLRECEVLLTLGAGGAMLQSAAGELHVAAARVPVVDTTAAGDTFLGYFLAARLRNHSDHECLAIANAAAGLCVSRPAAMDSIPKWVEVAAAEDG
jgi:ribokinase